MLRDISVTVRDAAGNKATTKASNVKVANTVAGKDSIALSISSPADNTSGGDSSSGIPSVSVSTTDPGYYRWTQWIFSQVFNSWYDTDRDRDMQNARVSDAPQGWDRRENSVMSPAPPVEDQTAIELRQDFAQDDQGLGI